MLSTLTTSKTRRKLLTLFLTHPEQRFYATQLIRDLGVSSAQMQNELKKLTGAGFLTSEKEANVRYFRINKDLAIYPELKGIVLKTVGVGDYLRESLQAIGDVEVALIYGSVARNVEDAKSDIDLLVVGNVNMDALHDAVTKAEEGIGREINPTVLSEREWKARVKKKQAFATDILKNPKIVLIGDEHALR